MLSSTLKKYMNNHNVKYTTISHPRAYTALQCAQAAHIKGSYLAKSVVVKLDNKFVLVAIPSHLRLDLDKLVKETHSKRAEIAHEYEFQDRFTDCELGAIPLFGELYGMDVYLADSLLHNQWLAFNAGNHNELLKIDCDDFLKLVHPKTLSDC